MVLEDFLSVISDGWGLAKPFVSELYPNLSEVLPNLVVMSASVLAYSVLVYNFYHFLGKRDVFEFDVKKYRLSEENRASRFFNPLLSVIKYGLFFPFVVLLWYGGFSIMLFLLAKNIGVAQILLVSVVFVAAIRVASYYTENLSNDLAKLIPFALLGIVIVDPSFFLIELFLERLTAVPVFVMQIASHASFIIILEWLLRILLTLKHAVFGVAKPEAEALEQEN